jgi:succinoglycan biosynthesis protein ExoM
MLEPESTDGGFNEQDTPLATIVIPTFKRPLLLRECISSCLQQQDLGARTFEILVVDNCPEGSAASAVEDAARSASLPIRYLHEPRPGASMARNAGLGRAKGKFAAFIDDDEVASERWLAHLLDTQLHSDADVVFGPVLPMMPESVNSVQYVFFQTLLTHWTDHPTGTKVGSTLLTPFWARGPHAYPSLASGNFLIHRGATTVKNVEFDDRLGRFGGEDVLYFNQLAANGSHFVWCAEAVAWEHVPPERLRVSYALTRAIRGGQVTSWIPMLLSPARPAMTALSMMIALVQVPAFASLACGSTVFVRPKRYHYLARLASAVGKLFWAAPFRRRAWPSWRSRS